jgi:hypothetical protein
MRSIITIVIVAAVAAVTTAWSISISSPSRGQVMFGGSNAVPTQTFVLW